MFLCISVFYSWNHHLLHLPAPGLSSSLDSAFSSLPFIQPFLSVLVSSFETVLFVLTSVFLVRGSLSPDLAPAPAYWRPLSEPGSFTNSGGMSVSFLGQEPSWALLKAQPVPTLLSD